MHLFFVVLFFLPPQPQQYLGMSCELASKWEWIRDGKQNWSLLSAPLLLLSCGLVYPHLLLRKLYEQRGVKAALEALGELQVRREADLVGPQHGGLAPRSAEVMHGPQQLLQTPVVVDHVSCQHVVVVEGLMGEIALQILTPGEGSHRGGVATAPFGVSHEIKCEIRQYVWQISGRHPSPWKQRWNKILFLISMFQIYIYSWEAMGPWIINMPTLALTCMYCVFPFHTCT